MRSIAAHAQVVVHAVRTKRPIACVRGVGNMPGWSVYFFISKGWFGLCNVLDDLTSHIAPAIQPKPLKFCMITSTDCRRRQPGCSPA